MINTAMGDFDNGPVYTGNEQPFNAIFRELVHIRLQGFLNMGIRDKKGQP